ncbi:MAG: glycosyltransferase 87 family protein [Actinomycetota bacterium]
MRPSPPDDARDPHGNEPGPQSDPDPDDPEPASGHPRAQTGPARRGIGLGLVLACLCATLAIGAAAKEPCADGVWSDGRQYTRLCYSDIVALLGTEQLVTGSRLPYLDPCVVRETACDEYPVGSMYAMRVAAWLAPSTGPALEGAASSRSYAGFFYWNAAILALAAVAIAVALYLLVGGRRALFFALSPTLLIYGFVNWDLLAVAFATLGTLAYIERRDGWSGTMLGLGAAMKAYPALVAIPFVVGRFRDRRPVGGTKLAWATAGTWLAVNLPFMLLATSGWWEFFRFNSRRPPDWDSLWYIGCERIPGAAGLCERVSAVNALSLLLFVVVSVLVWRAKARRQPDFPRWTFGFALLVVFLLTNKVYSPQYGLWLLPWFALVLPDLRAFAAFSVADVAVFVTRFAFFGQTDPGIDGWVDAFTIGWFQLAVLLRAGVLVWCVARWVRRPTERLPAEQPDPAVLGTAAPLSAPA